MTVYLLVEGINLYENLFDTDQLSIVRGTSFLYKNTITDISSHFRDALLPVSTGASSGLFVVRDADPSSVDRLIRSVRERLAQPPQALLPFALETCTADSCAAAETQLRAQLREHQLQQLTIRPDMAVSRGAKQYTLGEQPCELTGSRIRSPEARLQIQSNLNSPERRVCASAAIRYNYGRRERDGYYGSLVSDEVRQKLKTDYGFCPDINMLAEDPSGAAADETAHRVYPKLAGKIAVIYIDGNQFGDRQREFVKRFDHARTSADDPMAAIPDALAKRAFDQQLQGLRNQFLDKVLDKLFREERQTGYAPLENQQKLLRLETLLWGGDESLLIVPAWQGMAFMQDFFNHPWVLVPTADGEEKLPLTHAAGVVFCQAKSPIRIIQRIARALADHIKEQPGGRCVDRWDYMVLESIDYPTRDDVYGYCVQRYGQALAARRSSNGCRLPGLPPVVQWHSGTSDRARELIHGQKIAKRQLYQVLDAIRSVADSENAVAGSWSDYFAGPSPASDHPVAVAEARLIQVSEHSDWLKTSLPQLIQDLFGLDMEKPDERCWSWIHLLELWDYLVPQPSLSDATKRSEDAA